MATDKLSSDLEWMNDLQVGDQFDSMNSKAGGWSICTILQINKEKHQMYIHYEGWHKNFDEWIDVNDTESNKKKFVHKKAPLHTYTPKCKYLNKLKRLHPANRSNVVYHYDGQRHCLIITSSECVYKYDISNPDDMIWRRFATFPDGFMHSPVNNGNILDGDILYIFGGKTGCFGSLDLMNGEFKEILAADSSKAILSPVMFWLNDGKQLHVFGRKSNSVWYHIKYDKEANECTQISNSQQNGYQHLQNAKIVHNKYLNQWMNFSGARDIFVCDLSIQNDGFKWNKLDVMLPMDSLHYFVVNVSEYLVFILYIFDANDKAIWILDLNDNKWYKSNKQCPRMGKRAMPHIVNTKDGWLHFIGGNKYHLRLMISDVIPDVLYTKYQQKKNIKLHNNATKYHKSSQNIKKKSKNATKHYKMSKKNHKI
eukprot:322951_1